MPRRRGSGLGFTRSSVRAPRTDLSSGPRPAATPSRLDIEDILTAFRNALAAAQPAADMGSVVMRMADANPSVPSSPGFRSSISAEKADRKGDGHPEWSDERHTVLPLVEAARDGDKEAFGQLYRRFHSRVFGLARFYLGDAGEDAVAETFMRAWSALPRYRTTTAPFVAWLYGIARHVVADELKSRKRTEARDQLPDDPVHPHYDERLAITEAVAKLPKQQRQIVEMKYLLGMKNAEVARALNKSIGAVNAAQWRALQTLKQSLEQQ
ncbi:MAG: sigma-70 family RNA polymerase sigma factor [Actinomycetota bacterium]|nr:sigma-70 family RNA polymerase sigma factor [Actinomycetota bacterium]